MKNMNAKYTAISLFSGAGGMDLGFIRAGFEILWAIDIDKYACETYRTNIGKHIICNSVHSIDPDSLPECDVIVGGPPCQGFSVAGKMDPNDPRSQLIWEYHKIVKAKRPPFFVMENVAALGKLERFRNIREALCLEYKKIGYNVQYKILNSKDYGVPQKRERFILIGTLGPAEKIQFPVPLDREISAREALAGLESGHISNHAKIRMAKRPVMRKSPYAGMLFNGPGRPINLDEPAPTLPATMGGNRTPILDTRLLNDPEAANWIVRHHANISAGRNFDSSENEVPAYLRRLTVREAAKIQGFPDDYVFCGPQSQKFKQIGNAVPPSMAFHIARTLKQIIDNSQPLRYREPTSRNSSKYNI